MPRQITEREKLRIQLAIATALHDNHKITPIQWVACNKAALAVIEELRSQGHIDRKP